MATRSILTNVDIRDKGLSKKLVLALEHAQGKKKKDVTISRTHEDVSKENIKKVFGLK